MFLADFSGIENAVFVGEFEAGSESWHEARANGIGGSEIAAVVGLSPWESRYSLWHRKKGRLRPVRVSEPMRWGTLLEPVIAAEYAQHHLPPGCTMTTGGTFRHRHRAYQIANPDGLIWSEAGDLVDGVEIKVVGEDHHEKWPRAGSDAIPIYYRCQIAWYCDVLDLDSMVLRVLIGGHDARSYRVRPTLSDREYLRAEGEQFWRDLADDVPPNLDSHTETYRALRELHPDIDRSNIVDVPFDLAQRWWAAQAAVDRAGDEFSSVRSELADLMGTAWKARCGDAPVAYRVRPWTSDGDPYVRSAPRPVAGTSIVEAVAA